MATGWSARIRVNMQKYVVNASPPSAATTQYAGLNTSDPGDAGSSSDPSITPGTTEPSSTGSYARQAITWATVTQPAADAPANATNSADLVWGPSSAAYSTGASTLGWMLIMNTATLASVLQAHYEGRAQIAVPQAVNAAGITLTCAAGDLIMGCDSA